jgi:fructokinase
MRALGVDLGGTKIEGVVLDEALRPVHRVRVATERERGYDHILDRVAEVVAALRPHAPEAGVVGIGTPGSLSARDGTLKNSNTTCLNARPVHADLERRLGLPVRLENDANCFALAEARDGAAVGRALVFGVILGTGVGGGIAIRQRIHEGPNQIAGEWGHNPLPWMTEEERAAVPECYCGKVGCVETFLSGPALELDHALLSGARRSSQDIVRAASAGDHHAIQTLARYTDRLARALAAVINLLDPDAIVLGGGMSNLPDLASAVSAALPWYVFSDTVLTKVVLNVHGDSSGVRGAAWLWPSGPVGRA